MNVNIPRWYIAFKFQNLVYMDLLTSMWRTLQYFHWFESISRTHYIEQGISVLKNILSFHGLTYYRNMMEVLLSFLVLVWLCNTLARYVMEPTPTPHVFFFVFFCFWDFSYPPTYSTIYLILKYIFPHLPIHLEI